MVYDLFRNFAPEIKVQSYSACSFGHPISGTKLQCLFFWAPEIKVQSYSACSFWHSKEARLD